MRVLKAKEMKTCDEYTINIEGVPSSALMQRAAEAVAQEIAAGGFDTSSVLVLCGSGNNGGDGFALASILAQSSENLTSTYFTGDDSKMTDECAKRRRTCIARPLTDFSLDGVSLVVDAIYGIGFRGSPDEKTAEIINKVNESGIPVVAVDLPSGVEADSGAVNSAAIKADLTVAIAALKRGHLLYPGRSHSGRVVVRDIGIRFDALPAGALTVYTQNDLKMPARDPDANKGSCGKLLVVAGSPCMAGAAYLSALAAYRSGAGLVRIFTHEDNRVILQTLIPEAVMTTYKDDENPEFILSEAVAQADAVLVGPGLSTSKQAHKILKTVLKCAPEKLVIDADGLNLIAKSDVLRGKIPANAILTPHLGEMSRLMGASISEIKSEKPEFSAELAAKLGCICVLKDSVTAVSNGRECYLNQTGNAGMAKAGSGDVLAGIIGALLAQGLPHFESAKLGVYLHGRAGDKAARDRSEHSLLAREIAENIFGAF